MQRVLKLRLNGFKQVLVLYKKGAGALWLRMGQLLIRSLGAEIFFHNLSCIQIDGCQWTVDYNKFGCCWDYDWIEQIKSWLRQQSIILFTSYGDKPGGEAGESTRKEGGRHTSTWCAPKNTPALGVHRKIIQHLVCTKNTPAHLVFTSRHHQVSPDTNGGYALRLGKFDWKDFCCIVDWRQKLKKI